jgi:cell division septum initiation protein DivIVA
MSVYRVIDKLENVVKDGMWLPFGGRVVSADRVLDLIEKLRSTLPDDVSRAKQVTRDRDRLLEQAKEEAQSLMAEAQHAKDRAATDSEVTTTAVSKAEAIIADAETRARDIRRGADEYADHVLASLDASLAKALAAVQKGRQTLAASPAAQIRPNGSKSQEKNSV